ncbi:MAG TPA: DNA gyrase subunit A [Rhodospirillaceae bacterium]|nr:MAG: DNA gyrase subunit A [Alphaproteobacteria bacterium GWF2_58_20]HAU29707.1 DNA gyrase subunit A [Rhodospirillaceae bacterium]
MSDFAPVTIEEEMKRSYLDYAMSVIVARALPDVRDGLKPVHRRILYGMHEAGHSSDKPFKKSASIVGNVMGKYHPHGDSAIYDALVRMAQDFSMRLPLVDSQGNFGSMDGDPAAAMRYTEARMDKAGEQLLADIDFDTVDFQPNYDESLKEPMVLPARYPNLLVNGAGGIAVGMATNIPPHNLGEVIDACCAYVDNPLISIDELMVFVPGPDFPTGGLILGRSGIHSAYHEGRGSVLMRARTHFEEIRKDREAIIVTEVPYQVNKSRLIERMAEVVNEKIIEGISDLRDESDRDGIRVVIELKRDAVGEVVLNQLFKHTQLQTSFGVNALAINGGRPQMMNLREIIKAFVEFREEVITKRTTYLLGKARDRAHIQAGLVVAVANIDEVIKVIRNAADVAEARNGLLSRAWQAKDIAPIIALIDDPRHRMNEDGTYCLSEDQVKAILEMRLNRLTGLERDKIAAEIAGIAAEIKEHLETLANREKMLTILKNEMLEVKAKFGTERRTSIEVADFEIDIEDLIQREDMVVTVSHTGYIKRVPLSTYRAQHRGGKGRSGMATKDEDFVSDLFVASTHTPVLFFTTRGMVYKTKIYRLPLGNPQSRGKALINLLPLEQDEKISTILRLPEDETTWSDYDLVLATSIGGVRRNKLSDFANIRSNGLIAMKLEESGEQLIGVKLCTENDDVLLATKLGKCIRFPVTDVRVFAGRTSTGVRGVRLAKGDEVISMSILGHVEASAEERAAYLKAAAELRRAQGISDDDAAVDVSDDEAIADIGQLSPERFAELAAAEQFLLTIACGGFGKRSSAYEYRVAGRGGSGIFNMELTDKNGGEVVATFPVTDDHQVMLVTDSGQLIRTPVKQVRVAGRKTQGVTLFRVAEGEKVVSAASLIDENEDGNEGMEHDEETPETISANTAEPDGATSAVDAESES